MNSIFHFSLVWPSNPRLVIKHISLVPQKLLLILTTVVTHLMTIQLIYWHWHLKMASKLSETNFWRNAFLMRFNRAGSTFRRRPTKSKNIKIIILFFMSFLTVNTFDSFFSQLHSYIASLYWNANIAKMFILQGYNSDHTGIVHKLNHYHTPFQSDESLNVISSVNIWILILNKNSLLRECAHSQVLK